MNSEYQVLIRPRPGWIAIDWHELWEARELLMALVWRDIAVRYKQTVLGVAWAVLQPTFSMIIFTVIFGNFAKIPSDGVPYALFVFAGLLPWTYFSAAFTGASQSLVNQQALLTKIYLPRVFVPAASVGSALVDMAVSLVIYAALMLYYGMWPTLDLLALPLLLIALTAAALGAGLTLAAVTVTYRDFKYVVPFMTQAWMYLSPVIYPAGILPKSWQWVIALNPLVGIIEGFRSALLGRPWNLPMLAVSTLSAVVMLVFGLFYFRKTERRFADIA